ncbi:Rrf2 family protein [Caldicoprobacter guelmensis]|uniref:RrF2 family transcriptional regulator n=1 Tax=Caldicoprobacter guelmensis TaxID=1170224 RepID=UPI00195B00EA|nr:Rrf2 family transcriptional regulator [Caldicoprobacter guelmensis]MBM7583115.1 Rrf2 family protein [Caldicoprobacter guelmensis]
MRISTKGRYGLRAMVDLAIHSGGDYVPLNSIAERQNLSEGYLEQVFASLRKAGLVKSVKGPQGGYCLADDASKITVGDVLRVLEGDLSVVEGSDEGRDIENAVEYCINNEVWKKLNESIGEVLDSITLEDLVTAYKKLNNNMGLMYYI